MYGVPGIEDVQPRNVSLPRKYGYIRTKACLYLQRGPEYYRQQDYFSMPSEDWSDTDIQIINHGCRQIQNWMGGSPDRPLTGLGIHGFYNLMYLFHYERKEQALVDGNPEVMLDRIEFTHSVNGDSIILYNAVGEAFEPKFTISITEVNGIEMPLLQLIRSKTILNIADCKRLLNVLPVTIPAQISGDDIDSFADQLAEQGVVAQVVLAEDHRYPFRYDIRITSAYGERFEIIRLVSQITSKSLVHAKHIVSSLPTMLELDLTFEETRKITKLLKKVSAGFEVVSKADPLSAYRKVNTTTDKLQLGKMLASSSENATATTDGSNSKDWTHTFPRLADYIHDVCDIPGGEFLMGEVANEDENASIGDSQVSEPVVKIDLSVLAQNVFLSPFKVGKLPVSVALWTEYCNATGEVHPAMPTFGWTDTSPIVNVSWVDIMGFDGNGGFCKWICDVTGLNVRLPTDAEWEFLAVGGGIDREQQRIIEQHAWVSTYQQMTNLGDLTRPTLMLNSFGVGDLIGNVKEWCFDQYGDHPTETVIIEEEKTRLVKAGGLAGLLGLKRVETYIETTMEERPYDILVDPKGPTDQYCRCSRGCSFKADLPELLDPRSRGIEVPDNREEDLGFRLVIETPKTENA